MKLQNLTVIFIIIIIPIVLLMSVYISTGLKTIKYQSLYDTGLLNATHDAIYAFEINTANDELSNNPEIKREILKASIKMFKKSLCTSCEFSSYNVDTIEEYIPALVFGMYDGFYLYSPSGIYDSNKRKVEGYHHNLKNYVYYSETLNDGTIIRYSLDNYVVVTYKDGNNYKVKEGYLIDMTDSTADGRKYKGIQIAKETIDGEENTEGIKYYKDAYEFTNWFLNEANIDSKGSWLNIGSTNDPEDENSMFVKHKKEIIKEKIESVLNSTITSYSNRILGKTYKMPKLSDEDWEKIYTDISMISFFQGKRIGLTTYNGYCVLNSTNHSEYVNPNLLRFIKDGEYHDIRCVDSQNSTGYKIGSFNKKLVEKEVTIEDGEGNNVTEIISNYEYEHDETACYFCINGNSSFNQTKCIDENGRLKNIYEYVNGDENIQTVYWTSLGRERYKDIKIRENITASKLYLYNYGNENQSLTGGWYPSIMDSWYYISEYYENHSGQKKPERHQGAMYEIKTDHLRIGDISENSIGAGGFTTANKINIEDYDYINVKFKINNYNVDDNADETAGLNIYLSKKPIFLEYIDYTNNRTGYRYKQLNENQNFSDVGYEDKSMEEMRNISRESDNTNDNDYLSGKFKLIMAKRVNELKAGNSEDIGKIVEFRMKITQKMKESARASNGGHFTVSGYSTTRPASILDLEIYQVYLSKE